MIDEVETAETFEDFIRAVRQNKARLLEMYGGIDGLHKHMAEELPSLIQQGWKFVTAEEVAARNADF